jgi:hypothetical protein
MCDMQFVYTTGQDKCHSCDRDSHITSESTPRETLIKYLHAVNQGDSYDLKQFDNYNTMGHNIY